MIFEKWRRQSIRSIYNIGSDTRLREARRLRAIKMLAASSCCCTRALFWSPNPRSFHASPILCASNKRRIRLLKFSIKRCEMREARRLGGQWGALRDPYVHGRDPDKRQEKKENIIKAPAAEGGEKLEEKASEISQTAKNPFEEWMEGLQVGKRELDRGRRIRKKKTVEEVLKEATEEAAGTEEKSAFKTHKQFIHESKQRRRMYCLDKEKIKDGEKYIEMRPEVLKFGTLAEKESELFIFDVLRFPWERNNHYHMLRRLEKNYFPNDRIEDAIVPVESEIVPVLPDHTQKKVNRNPRAYTKCMTGRSPQDKSEKSRCEMAREEEMIEEGLARIRGHQAREEESTMTKKVLEKVRNVTEGRVLGAPVLVTKQSGLPASWECGTGVVVLINKPKGWTSFTVCGKLRRLTNIQKVGHAGTLDPLATGLLIVCVGKATKQVKSFMDMQKVYSGVFRLGETTSTLDADSQIIERKPWEHIDDEDIQKAAASFRGEIWQVPPMFSAIKVGGERMYDKARRGETLNLQPRRVQIHSIDVQRSLNDRQNLIFKVTCSKGTYIRSLCADFGRTLGSCAHLTALQRDYIGDYSLADAWNFSDLQAGIVKNYL